MSTITIDDVQQLARLSSLQLTPDEATGLQKDLANIVDYITRLSELDTSGVEPTYQVTGLKNVWRDDVAQESEVGRDELLALAPESQDNQVKVPKVL